MGLADVHAHLTHPRLATRQPEVLANARAAGVTSVLVNGLNPPDNEAVAELAKADSIVKPCFGLYPVDAVFAEMEAAGIDYPREFPPFGRDEAIAWVKDHAEQAFAIGEIGLDGYWVPEALWGPQEDAFKALVRIAMDADKAIIIHTRKRERRALEVLEELGATRVNWHCFGGRVKLARQIADKGHTLSIPANARRNEAFTRMIETLPRERLLLETDCPYLGLDKDVPSEPAHVRATAEFFAETWGCSLDDVEDQLASNFERLFGQPP
ncbi:MAG: TatD family hydrolase [Sandaracinaceae bacterium]